MVALNLIVSINRARCAPDYETFTDGINVNRTISFAHLGGLGGAGGVLVRCISVRLILAVGLKCFCAAILGGSHYLTMLVDLLGLAEIAGSPLALNIGTRFLLLICCL